MSIEDAVPETIAIVKDEKEELLKRHKRLLEDYRYMERNNKRLKEGKERKRKREDDDARMRRRWRELKKKWRWPK